MDRRRDALAVAARPMSPACMKGRATKFSYCAAPAMVENRLLPEMGGYAVAPSSPYVFIYKANALCLFSSESTPFLPVLKLALDSSYCLFLSGPLSGFARLCVASHI